MGVPWRLIHLGCLGIAFILAFVGFVLLCYSGQNLSHLPVGEALYGGAPTDGLNGQVQFGVCSLDCSDLDAAIWSNSTNAVDANGHLLHPTGDPKLAEGWVGDPILHQQVQDACNNGKGHFQFEVAFGALSLLFTAVCVAVSWKTGRSDVTLFGCLLLVVSYIYLLRSASNLAQVGVGAYNQVPYIDCTSMPDEFYSSAVGATCVENVVRNINGVVKACAYPTTPTTPEQKAQQAAAYFAAPGEFCMVDQSGGNADPFAKSFWLYLGTGIAGVVYVTFVTVSVSASRARVPGVQLLHAGPLRLRGAAHVPLGRAERVCARRGGQRRPRREDALHGTVAQLTAIQKQCTALVLSLSPPTPTARPKVANGALTGAGTFLAAMFTWRSPLLLGQAVAMCVGVTGYCSQSLARRGVAIPTTQTTLTYGLLASFLLYLRGNALKLPLWRYVLLAVADVEANYFVVKAYQFTSVTSVMLLDCFTIPCVMALSVVFLRRRYRLRHFVGVAVCLVGLALLVVADFQVGSSSAAPAPVTGDVLCVVGAVLYSISNVGQEAVVKAHLREEYLGMIGILGLVISGVQLTVLERHELEDVPWNAVDIGLILTFVAAMFTMYTLTTVLLRVSDACLFNLSLLTSDVWGVLIGYFLLGSVLTPLYLMSLATTVIGVTIFHTAASPDAESTPQTDTAQLLQAA